MEWLSLDSIVTILGILFGGGSGAFVTWRWMKKKAKAEAESAEVDMAQKVQDTYQQMLEDKQKEVEDNHRLIAELRADRDHYKQGYLEFREQVEQLQKDFSKFRRETEDERDKMKRDIARNGRQLECLRHFLCGREDCALRVPVTISQVGEISKPDGKDHQDIEPYNEG